MNEYELEVAKEMVKQVPLKEAYGDIAKPALASTGQVLGLIPRAINAALEPLQIWILQREFNIAAITKLLADKLENINPEKIVSPESYIAVPALQAISYCMDNELLRNMYANLLASSMNLEKKSSVHPAYVEIIKQMSPDEAKLFNYLPRKGLHGPIIDIKETRQGREGVFDYYSNASTLGYDAKCDFPDNAPMYINNLCRLGIAEIPPLHYLVDEWRYAKIFESEIYATITKGMSDENNIRIERKSFGITDFGDSFRKACM